MRAAVHVGQLLQPVPGGIGRYVEHLVAHLPGAGVEPHTFAAGPMPRPLPHHTDLGWPRGSLRYEAWHRLRRPRVRVPGDVVHATSLAVPPAGHRPLVVTVHDLVFLRFPELLTARGVSFHRRGLELARREAAAVVVPSVSVKDDLLDEGFRSEVVHVAHHGVDAPARHAAVEAGGGEAASADDAALAALGVSGDYVLFVGTIEPRKGIADLLAAFGTARRAAPGLTLVVVGGAGWGEPPDLDRPGVVAPGWLGDDALDVLYRRATAFALPSTYEGFGLPVVEAMARGCPVVVSDTPSLTEVAGGAALVVPVGDVDALAAALVELALDRARGDDLARRGRARAAGFTWAASAESHRAAYEAALAAT